MALYRTAETSFLADSGNETKAVQAVAALRNLTFRFANDPFALMQSCSPHPLVLCAAVRCLCSQSSADYPFPVALPYPDFTQEELRTLEAVGLAGGDAETQQKRASTFVNSLAFFLHQVSAKHATALLAGSCLDAGIYLCLFPPDRLLGDAGHLLGFLMGFLKTLDGLLKLKSGRKVLASLGRLPAPASYSFPYPSPSDLPREMTPGPLPDLLWRVLVRLPLEAPEAHVTYLLLHHYCEMVGPETLVKACDGQWMSLMLDNLDRMLAAGSAYAGLHDLVCGTATLLFLPGPAKKLPPAPPVAMIGRIVNLALQTVVLQLSPRVPMDAALPLLLHIFSFQNPGVYNALAVCIISPARFLQARHAGPGGWGL